MVLCIRSHARWVPVHLCDMDSLPTSIKDEFEVNGNWVARKTQNLFSAMAIDQAHEQNNDLVNGSGGAVGLTENSAAFQKWMLAWPEQARVLKEFEMQYSPQINQKFSHHEEWLSTQETFNKQVLALVQTIEDMGNPFLDGTPELISLDMGDIVDESVVDTVRRIKTIGQNQFNEYQKLVILDRTSLFMHPSKRIPLHFSKGQNKSQRASRQRKLWC